MSEFIWFAPKANLICIYFAALIIHCTNQECPKLLPYAFVITVPNCCLFSLLVTCLCCVCMTKSIIWNSGTQVWLSFIHFFCLYLMSSLTLTCDLHFYELPYYMILERYINQRELGCSLVIFSALTNVVRKWNLH